MLDTKVCEGITSLVEKLATSGKQQIDQKIFKELVANAGKGKEYIKFCLERIFLQLEQKHSEIRLGAFLIVDELFRRSAHFRELLLDEFPTFLELTVESNPDKLLPPPLSTAKILKQKVLQAIHKWYSRFGEENKRLFLGYNFLKNCLKVDFQDALSRNAAELRTIQVENERLAKVIEKKLSAIEKELEENQDEIVRLVTEMDNCFCLLIPRPEDAFGPSNNSEVSNSTEGLNLREHGFQNAATSLSINITSSLNNIQETEDNAPILDNLRDFNSLLKNRYSPMIKKWVHIVSKSANQSLFRKLMDLKKMVDAEIKRFNQLQFTKEKKRVLVEEEESSESESDSDFEEVAEKEGYEAEVVSTPVQPTPSTSTKTAAKFSINSKEGSWKLWSANEEDAIDPTSLLATLNNIKSKEKPSSTASATSTSATTTTSTATNIATKRKENDNETNVESRKAKLLKLAPKLPYDVDLYHWEDKDKDLKAPSVEIVEKDGHKFWTPSQDREGETIEDPNGIASLRTRVIEFSGNFQPVKWSCRSPLPSGALCPRKDRFKCPLHGKIIGRDELGTPTNPEDIAELEKAKEKEEANKPPEWQDPQFLKEIEAEIGIDLTINPPKKGKGKKKTFAEMYPSLTDIDKRKNTSRTRLERKVFNKTAMKRVANTLDEMNYKKHKDKFGDQWNYSMHDG